MHPPFEQNLPIDKLSQIFQKMTNSYKSLLFKSILDLLNDGNLPKDDKGNSIILFSELCAGMFVTAIYPLKLFKLSLGLMDQTNKYFDEIENILNLQINVLKMKRNEVKNIIVKQFQSGSLLKIEREILEKNVLYRLIKPWEQNKINDLDLKQTMEKVSQEPSLKCLYSIYSKKRAILVSAEWVEYIQKNYAILNGWWEVNFLYYLEKNNRGVPNIIEKLVPSEQRDLSESRKYWQEFIEIKKPRYIFSTKYVDNNFSLDHFMPWTLLCHNELWNLSPIEKEMNSSKGNKLPDKKFVVPFAKLQWQFLQFHLKKRNFKINDKFGVEYLRDLRISSEVLPRNDSAVANVKFIDAYQELYEPYYPIAKRMGFSSWVYPADFNNMDINLISNNISQYVFSPKPIDRFNNCVPLIHLKATGGAFDLDQYLGNTMDSQPWVRIEDNSLKEGMFVMQIVGSSMSPLINDGDYCLFRPVGGTRNGLVVLVQLSDNFEPNQNAKFTVKTYYSQKKVDELGNFKHTKITLKAKNPKYDDIVIEDSPEDKFKVLGEFVKVIELKNLEI